MPPVMPRAACAVCGLGRSYNRTTMAPTRPFQVYSERHGQPRQLHMKDVADLVFKRIARMRDHQWLLREAFGSWKDTDGVDHGPTLGDPEEFMMIRLRVSDLGYALRRGDSAPSPVALLINGGAP